MGGNCLSNRTSTTLPRIETTAPAFEKPAVPTCLLNPSGNQQKVVVNDVDEDGRKRHHHADPEPPVVMRAFPARSLMHSEPSISSHESRADPGHICRCTACARSACP